jgi:hypothetical protein
MICLFGSQVNLSVMEPSDGDRWLECALGEGPDFPPALCESYLRLPQRQMPTQKHMKLLSASFANGFPFAGYL